MFECVFEKQGLVGSNIGIAGNVVDETRDITIPSTEEEEEEEFPWLIIAIVAGVSIIGVLAFAMLRK